MRDEMYVLDLCDAILGRQSLRQHRFSFLIGDTGRPLPVDAFYADINLVIEYRERQHSETVPFFDRRATVSGVPRGVQRAIYDQRRRDILPQHGVELVELNCTDFKCKGARRLVRCEAEDRAVIFRKLQAYVANQVFQRTEQELRPYSSDELGR